MNPTISRSWSEDSAFHPESRWETDTRSCDGNDNQPTPLEEGLLFRSVSMTQQQGVSRSAFTEVHAQKDGSIVGRSNYSSHGEEPRPSSFMKKYSPKRNTITVIPKCPPEHLSLNGVRQRNRWNIRQEQLLAVPAYYPLERTHVIVPFTTMNPEDISALICLACQRLSLQADFDSNAAIATLTSSDGTTFEIKMFKAREESTIVEAQKLSGESETFYTHAQKILQVKRGLEYVQNISLPHTKASVLFQGLEEMKQDSESEQNMIQTHLQLAANLLSKDRIDANHLGLQLLRFMTDPTKSPTTTCQLAGRAVLRDRCDKAHVETDEAFQFNMMQLFLRTFELIDNEVYEEMPRMTEQRMLVLEVIANALYACTTDDEDLQSFWICIHVDHCLVKFLLILRRAVERPHEAVLAMKCLDRLMQLFPQARKQAISLNVFDLVYQANKIGQCSHSVLASEAERLYRTLVYDEQECQAPRQSLVF